MEGGGVGDIIHHSPAFCSPRERVLETDIKPKSSYSTNLVIHPPDLSPKICLVIYYLSLHYPNWIISHCNVFSGYRYYEKSMENGWLSINDCTDGDHVQFQGPAVGRTICNSLVWIASTTPTELPIPFSTSAAPSLRKWIKKVQKAYEKLQRAVTGTIYKVIFKLDWVRIIVTVLTWF